VAFAYERQSECDPERLPFYLECLQVITDARSTETLQTKVAVLQSQGVFSRRDITAAYSALNIGLDEAGSISDDRIIGLYQSQLPDVGASRAEELRQALYKLGVVRQSPALLQAAQQMVDTYEDALRWLGNGAGKETEDEGIVAVYGVKVR
jgi:ubiquitin carboxyl-terminal hydrolase 25